MTVDIKAVLTELEQNHARRTVQLTDTEFTLAAEVVQRVLDEDGSGRAALSAALSAVLPFVLPPRRQP